MDSLVTDVDKQYEMAALGQSKIWQYNVYGKTTKPVVAAAMNCDPTANVNQKIYH